MERCQKTQEAVRLQLPAWFSAHQRDLPWRHNRTPYRVWISELMLQQTQVAQAAPYFLRFMQRFPSIETLAAASLEEVLKQWEGLGYYARARNMHKTARIITGEFKGRFPSTAEELIKLPGIGSYTAAAIGSLAFNLDMAALDGNMERVLARLHAYRQNTRSTAGKKALRQFAGELLVKGKAGRFNEAMMELGATVCRPSNPACSACPLSQVCLGFQLGNPSAFPVKPPRKKVPHVTAGAAVISSDKGEVLVTRRRTEEMLGGLWAFPGGKQRAAESIQECIARKLKEMLDITVKVEKWLLTVKHAYSHFTMDLHAYSAKIISGQPRALACLDFQWFDIPSLRKAPYSKADLKIIKALEQS